MKNKKQTKTAQSSNAEGKQPEEQKPLTTRQQLRAINGVHCLYKHDGTGEYYGIKKHLGKIKTKCLEVSDRKLAEAKLAAWIEEIEGTTGGLITVKDLAEKWLALMVKSKPRSKENYRVVKEKLVAHFSHNPQVQNIKVSELINYLGEVGKDLKPATFNALAERTSKIFELAVVDNNLIKNPFESIPKNLRYRKVIRKEPTIPTLEQFNAIVHHIRTQRWSDTREEASDLAEFMGLAALGTAECAALRWEDINFNEKEINNTRKKTDKPFIVPFYPWLATWLDAFWMKRGCPTTGRVFKVECIKESIKNACRKLKYPRFTPRNLRQMGIVRLLRAGFPPKLIAMGQGHKDESLILKVYSKVVSSGDKDYLKQQLEKLAKAEEANKALTAEMQKAAQAA